MFTPNLSDTASRRWPEACGVRRIILITLCLHFPSSFTFNYDANSERTALRHWPDNEPGRAIPAKAAHRLLLATWNIANLGAQDRRPEDFLYDSGKVKTPELVGETAVAPSDLKK